MVNINKIGDKKVGVLLNENQVIKSTSEALDIMGDAMYRGAEIIVLKKENFHLDFYDLKTGMAGDILQKFSTYNMRLAIMGDFTKVTSKSLNDFIYESNKGKRILFVNSQEEFLKSL